MTGFAPDGGGGARSRLAADRTAGALRAKKGLLTCIEREVAPGQVTGGAQFRLPALSAAQRKAAEEIRAAFADRATVLLRGVTGSGKTEIYMHFAAEVLARGGQVLLLVPEIALTAQLVDRLRRVFGERVIAYHSKLTDRKRTELYLRLRDQGVNVVMQTWNELWHVFQCYPIAESKTAVAEIAAFLRRGLGLPVRRSRAAAHPFRVMPRP